MKKNKGITMISLVITIIVLLIVTSITIYNGLGQMGIKRVNYLYADIDAISTKVAEYYLKNGTLPVYDNLYVNNKEELEELFEKNGATENITNVNDGDEYYVINLAKLDNLTLNYGDDYKEWTNTSTPQRFQNIYIINSVTHQIYFPHGLRSGDEYFFTRFPDENEITAVELGEIEDEWNLNVTNITKTNIDDDNVTIVADVTLSGLKENYDLNSLEYTWTESNEESEPKNITFTKFNVNNVSEENMNATLASKHLRNIEGKYYLCVKATDKNGKPNYKYSNRVLVSPVLLPSEYQKVEYIESTGKQWIDTEVIANNVNRINIKFSLTNNRAIYGIVGGGWSVNNSTFQIIYNYNTNLIALKWGETLLTAEYNTKIHNALISKEKVIIDNSEIDNTSSINDARSVCLFARRSDNLGNGLQQYSFCRIYNCTLNSDSITRDFIPCYRKSDNVKGLYDIAEGKFYTNQGTGDDFIAGDNVY